jgi:hypothetical protein
MLLYILIFAFLHTHILLLRYLPPIMRWVSPGATASGHGALRRFDIFISPSPCSTTCHRLTTAHGQSSVGKM